MRISRLDRRLTGAALATACCLLIPTQEKPLLWLSHQASHLAPPPRAPQPPAERSAAVDEQAAARAVAPESQAQTQTRPEPQNQTQAEATEAAPQAERAKEAAALGYDLKGVPEALKFYRDGEHEMGDAALVTKDPLARAAVEWSFLRNHAVAAGLERIAGFMRARPEWPLAALRLYAEDLAAVESAKPERVAAYFAEFPPTGSTGAIAYATLLRNVPARSGEAERMAREIWRASDLNPAQEKRLLKNFGGTFTAADHIYRADRAMLREQTAAAGRAAALAGKDALALFRAQADLLKGVAWAKVASRAPASLRDDPALLYARIHNERHAEHIDEAARLMLAAPRDPAKLASPDDWWTERRLIARKLLDAGDFARAYRICAEHSASSNEAQLEAEFHAGWIALRFLGDPALATPHFEKMALIARTPHSSSRAAYWLGRAAEAQGKDGRPFYARAAGETETFYGQLARAKLGDEPVALRPPTAPAEGAARAAPVRAAELLFTLGEKDSARQLALESARILDKPEQMAALSRIIEDQGDARTSLIAGKAALRRGIAIDTLAYPINGVPYYVALANSASRTVVMAIARQESAFDATARSGAGAFGLMQMIAGTARNAAQRAGVAYDEARLKTDAAFNAQLGAFHLGQLLDQYNGSHILTFAAYNAGGGNVRDWIKAYGDPRDSKVDPIDWIERIPFTETRNYVQRVAENLHVYRARLGDSAPSLFTADLRQKVATKD